MTTLQKSDGALICGAGIPLLCLAANRLVTMSQSNNICCVRATAGSFGLPAIITWHAGDNFVGQAVLSSIARMYAPAIRMPEADDMFACHSSLSPVDCACRDDLRGGGGGDDHLISSCFDRWTVFRPANRANVLLHFPVLFKATALMTHARPV
jgi:hypothetical protein